MKMINGKIRCCKYLKNTLMNVYPFCQKLKLRKRINIKILLCHKKN